MNLLMIDNYDSFTYNLVQYFGQLGVNVVTLRNDHDSVANILSEQADFVPDKVVISPGPGNPNDAGICLDLVKEISKMVNPIPILGVCLGHQTIGMAFGGKVVNSRAIMHGKVSNIVHTGTGLFKGIPSPYNVTRYHSLALSEADLPNCLEIIAKTNDQEIMAISHSNLPIYGVQFHPEAILTEWGHELLRNFLEIT
ncbi:MAG: anthranilate/aminodeoxychorismate synthase component II [Betaproteobacteria bacterium TMED82]|nr:MAG: anthranilate/aminodeoxychorismate synthase component II [Betaproteobacteria bacterium TMED82]